MVLEIKWDLCRGLICYFLLIITSYKILTFILAYAYFTPLDGRPSMKSKIAMLKNIWRSCVHTVPLSQIVWLFFEHKWLVAWIFLYLKSSQNKKGQKKFPGAEFSVSFSQLPAVKKDTINCAPGNFFGPFCDDFTYIVHHFCYSLLKTYILDKFV